MQLHAVRITQDQDNRIPQRFIEGSSKVPEGFNIETKLTPSVEKRQIVKSDAVFF